MPIHKLFFLVPALVGLATPLRAETDWIQPGTFIQWPDSLKEPPSITDFELPEPSGILQTQFTDPLLLPEPVLFPVPMLLDEETDQFVEPEQFVIQEMGVTDFDRVSTYTWQVLPPGLLFHNYLAGEKEPRTAATWLWDRNRGLIWEAAVGSRWGLLRHGTQGTNAEGFQFDVEGAALVRIDPVAESDLEAADFRAGFVGTWRKGQWRWKTGFYHISSHVGDEYMIRYPAYDRVNYVRDSWLWAAMYDITPALQTYGEIAYAIGAEGGAEPVELQFGLSQDWFCRTRLPGPGVTA